jgi:hypothetical protein
MLIENAFHYLPEILCGSNYAVQEYEAGVVNAISLAVLQELNARNLPNPLSALTIEKLYSPKGFERPDDPTKSRYLRADLFVDTLRSRIATTALARFGWRHKNYLEAKFFRVGTASTLNAADLLGDVIRLCVLVPPTVIGWNRTKNRVPSPCEGAPSATGEYSGICVGRYLLHVYEVDPKEVVGYKNRPWLETLRTPGTWKFDIRIGDDPSQTFRQIISIELEDLELHVEGTNQVVAQSEETGDTAYTCVLTRIDALSAQLGDLSWTETRERTGVEGTRGDWKKFQALIGKHLLFSAKPKTMDKVKAENVPPSTEEVEEPGIDAEDTAT